MESSVVKEVESGESFPEKISLVSPVLGTGSAVRLVKSGALASEVTIHGRSESTWMIFRHCFQCHLGEAFNIRVIRLKLGGGTSDEQAALLLETKLSLFIDREPIIQEEPFQKLIQQKEVVLPSKMQALFLAAGLDGSGGADLDIKLGYMLPHGSLIKVELADVPKVLESADIVVSVPVALYTSRMGCLK